MTPFTIEQENVFSDPFSNDNAKYLNPLEVAKTFVPVGSFWDLFADKNHVLLGARGSGKTAVGRMLSHDHLKLLDHPRAKKYIAEKRYIGVYTPARLNWVSGIKSQALAHDGPERDYFILRINFVMAQAFLATLKSCLDTYTPINRRAPAEEELVQDILALWAPNVAHEQPISTLRGLGKLLTSLDFRLQRKSARAYYQKSPIRPSSIEDDIVDSFQTGLAQPITTLWDISRQALDLPDSAKFLVAIDEMELLTEEHHKILNGLLRAYDNGFVFKFITAPYCHYTLATETNAPLIEDHDFEYILMDHDRSVASADLGFELPGAQQKFAFQIALFQRRAHAAGIHVDGETLGLLLGESEVLDPSPVNNSNLAELARRAQRHVNGSTMKRIADKLLLLKKTTSEARKSKLRSEISNSIFRKLKPAIVMREKVRSLKGADKGEAYSGLSMILACTDGNPRIVLRIYKRLFPDLRGDVEGRGGIPKPVWAKRQNDVMETISDRLFGSIQAVPEHGPILAEFIGQLGSFFHQSLHGPAIGTDVYGSVRLADDDADIARLVRTAVAWGFMYPHFKDERRPALPVTAGEFRLAYALAPHFKILPRRGRTIALRSIIPQRHLGL